MDVLDWHLEGRRWASRFFSHQGFDLYGGYQLTHLRALLRLTDNAQQWLAAQAGWRERMREINAMPNIFDELDRLRDQRF